MKKQIFVFLCTIIFIVLPFSKGLVINNNLEEINNITLDDNVPVWKLGDSWTYDIDRFQFNLSASGSLMILDSSINNFIMEMIGYSESSYILDLSGKIKGNFQYESGEGLVLKGKLLFASISGNIYFRQNDLANEQAYILIKSIALLTNHPFQIPIPIPIPLTITINVNQNSSRPFIDFPLYDGKQGLINETSISANIKFDSIVLQILSIFFASIPNEILYEETVEIPIFNYLAEIENITVGAGAFDAYNISFAWGLFGSMYYAPLVGNIVKAESVIEIPDQFTVLLIGELLNYNY